MNFNRFCIAFLLFLPVLCVAQFEDSTIVFEEIIVNGYPDQVPVLHSPVSISMVDSARLSLNLGYSLVPAMNTMPGVRMEERSPGSYRLSIRGSLLRSPFGVRNVKLYLGEFPFTDAGGNSYLHLLDAGAATHIEVLKGPHGSLFGANTGGVVNVNLANRAADTLWHAKSGITAGSYGLLHQQTGLSKNTAKNKFSVYQGYQQATGYRQNSAMSRYYMHLADEWQYATKGKLTFLALLSDLAYQTPGGLTLRQFQQDPSAARPRAGAIAGAVEQKAAIYNQTFFGGISHEARITGTLRHVLSVFGSGTDFKNPFITNYEHRHESSYGLRTYLEWNSKEAATLHWNWFTGMELQHTQSSIYNYGNRKGEKDTLQAADQVNARHYTYFTQISGKLGRFTGELGVSLNNYQLLYAPIVDEKRDSFKNRKFDLQWMPRAGLSYRVMAPLYARASVSKGYSPPTIAELRPSDNQIYAALNPETGWNYELGLRFQNTWLRSDVSTFWFKLDQAIVRRLNAAGQEYFVNTGATNQPGVEWQIQATAFRSEVAAIRLLELGSSVTLYRFTFESYQNSGIDYSGKQLTGVPNEVLVSHVRIVFPWQLYVYGQHTFTSRLPVNDLNTEFASDYHLFQLKAGWKTALYKRLLLHMYAGIDNASNTVYSLGNDLNAVGGRYYNAAAPRNYYAGLNFSF